MERISFSTRISRSFEEVASYIEYSVSYAQVGPYDPSSASPAFAIFDESIVDENGTTLFNRSNLSQHAMGNTHMHLAEDRTILAAIRAAQLAGDYEEVHPVVTEAAREIGRITKFRLDPQNLARPSRRPDMSTERPSDTPPPRLDYRGEDLASVLYYLEESNDPLLGLIGRKLATVLPGFEGFEFNTVGTDRIGFSAVFSDSRGTIPAANLSDGTLSLIGLMTLLLSPGKPAVICLEEPENGLTPSAIDVL
jgi:hypothetical protein